MRGRPNRSALRRFFSNIEVSQSGCWDWCGCRNGSGYGSFGWLKLQTTAHRIAYMWFVSADVAGMVIDHLCRTRSCVNPAHLEAVTLSVNALRGNNAKRRPKALAEESGLFTVGCQINEKVG